MVGVLHADYFFNMAVFAEELNYLCLLKAELTFICHVLQLAAAAFSGDGAKAYFLFFLGFFIVHFQVPYQLFCRFRLPPCRAERLLPS